MLMNSKEYWDNRFEKDWLDFAGDKQTEFFADILCEMLPDYLIKETMSNEYSVCDMGCAMGEGIPIFSRKLGVNVDGMDFSEEALSTARLKNPGSTFWFGDLMNLEYPKTYDIVICSNVLEHFTTPWLIFKKLAEMADKYIVLMVPYREELKIEEHNFYFSEEVIPVQIAGFSLDYVRTVDGKNVPNSYYPDQQILLIYKKGNQNIQMLSELTEGISQAQNRKLTVEYDKQIEQQRANWMAEKESYCKKIQAFQREKESLSDEFVLLLEEKKKLESLLLERTSEKESLTQLLNGVDSDAVKEKKRLYESTLELEAEKELLTQQLADNQKLLPKLMGEISEKDNIIRELNEKLNIWETNVLHLQSCVKELEYISSERDKAIYRARSTCYRMDSKISYKFLCVIVRFVHQFLLGNWTEKKTFLSICKNFLIGKKDTFSRNDGYNMILNIANQLVIPSGNDSAAAVVSSVPGNSSGEKKADTAIQIISPNDLDTKTSEYLSEKYDKPDVLIFSVINYDFRHQRPQHFASRFAENGHRVFYVNANFVNKENIKELADHLYVVDFYSEFCNAVYYAPEWNGYAEWFREKMDTLIRNYAIRDAIIILDYPNWVYGAEYLRSTYGFKIIVDYMDDFTGFLGTTTNVLKDNCVHMLKTSDLVVASSQFLYDIAVKYAKEVAVVRNGTEVDHFYQAVSMEEHHKRPVIGYYGAVSHWFAWEKVCHVAKNMPECDIVIIGEVTEHRDKLEQYSNIKLLGEKNYKELPKHLAYFDVCLIPFDTSTDLIKATNPVKFYEYLSAGKRIVATDIPELEPYRDKYVYMSNDDDQFLEYVRICLNGHDTLESKENCISFAMENDWQKRYEKFAEACISVVPKVSIIVLTYNNLNLTKCCIDSILQKTAYPNYELIILDNQSADGTVEYLKELDGMQNPRVKVILNAENSGFAGGNNIAIAASSGEYIMLLNNDTVVTRGWLTNVVKHLENDPSCGMCGAVTNSIGNEAMIAVNYKNIKELDRFAYLYTGCHNNQIYTNVDRLAMFCTLIRRSIVNEYGGLDINYQVGMFEDDDYAKVIEKAGFRLYIAEDVFVHHVNNASFKKLESDHYKSIFDNNRKYFENKWSAKWHMPKYREGVTATINDGMMVEPK